MSGWPVPTNLPMDVAMDVPIDIDRAEAQGRALEELAKAKYGGTPSFVSDAFRRLLEFLERLSDFLSGIAGARGGGGVGPGFVIAVVVLLAAIVLVIWKVGIPRLAKRSAPSDELELDSTRPAADYRARAEAAAAAGDWPTAVGDRFRALVRELEIRTVIDVRPARTAWEAAMAAHRVLRDSGPDLFTGADLFSRVCYGDRRAASSDYETMSGIDERVTAAADAADLTDLTDSAGQPGWRRRGRVR